MTKQISCEDILNYLEKIDDPRIQQACGLIEAWQVEELEFVVKTQAAKHQFSGAPEAPHE